MHLKKDEEN